MYKINTIKIKIRSLNHHKNLQLLHIF